MKQNARVSPRLIVLIVLVLFLLNLAALAWLGWPVLQNRRMSGAASPSQPVGAPSQTTATLPAQTETHPADPTQPILAGPEIQMDAAPNRDLANQGAIILSLRFGNQVNLFAYQPGHLPLTRLTDTTWDEIDPAVSPDGKRLAYASRQNGYWDLYIRDLSSGQVERVTDTPDYEGQPSWSPDRQWLSYAGTNSGNLDIYLISLSDPAQVPIRLTEDPSADSSPAWSPQGRKIAFTSTRDGSSQIWLADLDRTDEGRLVRLSREPQANHLHPRWSPDGRYLAWSSQQNGERKLLVWDTQTPDFYPIWNGYGGQPAWSPDGQALAAAVLGPNQNGLQVYRFGTADELTPMLPLSGSLYGLTWAPGPLEGWLAEAVQRGDIAPPPSLVQAQLRRDGSAAVGTGRIDMVEIPDVNVPYALLSDAVDEAFQALRQAAAVDSGWDILSSLENAYLPLTSPATPSIQEEWLYTGRAFAINPLILSAGWMVVVREDFNGQTYWRVYLKARYQDGSAGAPLDCPIWDINARFSGGTSAYENGGQYAPPPEGYWIDLTELAGRYGWERLASRPNWRSFFPAIRFNQFVYRDGLDWHTAMAQVYPPEALATPTSMPTATSTSTPTQAPTRYRTTITPSPTPSPTATRRPTLTTAP